MSDIKIYCGVEIIRCDEDPWLIGRRGRVCKIEEDKATIEDHSGGYFWTVSVEDLRKLS